MSKWWCILLVVTSWCQCVWLPVTELSRLSILEPGVCSRPLSGLLISTVSSSMSSSSSSSSGTSVSKSEIRFPDTYPRGGTGAWGGCVLLWMCLHKQTGKVIRMDEALQPTVNKTQVFQQVLKYIYKTCLVRSNSRKVSSIIHCSF